MLAARVALLAVLAMRPALAQTCDPREAEELRVHLAAQARKAQVWNWTWRATFTSAAVGTLAVGLADPFPSLREGLFVSSGKATIGALARWFLPLHIDVPATTGETCADLAALRASLARAARRERNLFWTGHVGGIAVNLGGAAILWYRGSLGQALLSIAVGYPVGLLSNYMMPRASWRLHRERAPTWSVAVVPERDGLGLAIGGAF